MLQVSAPMRIIVAVMPVDFRKGVDGLCGICKALLGADPFSGVLVVFRNRKSTSLKVLAYDGQGFWLCTKRLSVGRFKYWPQAGEKPDRELLSHQLSVLLMAGDPDAGGVQPNFRALPRPVLQQ